MRHAKSSHKEARLDDFERPLNGRGRSDAPRMGRLLADENLGPDLIVASSAKRTRKTTDLVAEACGFRGETRLLEELYAANPEQILAVVRRLPDFASRVLLIGHNPGLEQFLEALTGCWCPLPTASLSRVELPIDNWQDAGAKQAKLESYWEPGDPS